MTTRLATSRKVSVAGCYKIDASNRFTGAINAICASGTKNLAFTYSPV